MAGFQFRLQKVLKAREIYEDKRKQELASIRQDLNAKLEKIAQLKETYSGYQKEIREAKRGKIDLYGLQRTTLFLEHMSDRIDRLQKEATVVRNRMEKKKEELLTAQKERKSIEKIRERDLLNYKKEEKRRQLRMMDEVAALQHNQSFGTLVSPEDIYSN